MKSFDEYKINCKYFKRESIPRDNLNSTFIKCIPSFIENCNHPLAGNKVEITSKACSEKNEFCFYNKLNNNQD